VRAAPETCAVVRLPAKSGKRFLLKLALCPNRQDYRTVT
jgi:hypothetical protein